MLGNFRILLIAAIGVAFGLVACDNQKQSNAHKEQTQAQSPSLAATGTASDPSTSADDDVKKGDQTQSPASSNEDSVPEHDD